MSEMILSLQEMFASAKSGKIQMHSALGSRDESRQTRQFTTRIQKMKTVCGLNSRMLIMKDIVLPFNPFTGISDDVYNDKRPFRPILLPSQVIGQIKAMCVQDGELKALYKRILGAEFSEEEGASYDDYLLFKNKGFIKPRITTYDVISVDLKGREGFPEFKVNYTVDSSKLNEERTYDVSNAPAHHKLAVLFNAICREEWKDQESILKANHATDDQITTAKRTVFAKSPISFVKPKNLVPFFFFDIDQEFPDIKEENFMDIEKYIRYYSYTDKWQTAFEDVAKDPAYDELIDFYDFTVKTPSSGSTSTNGTVYTDEDPNAIYQALSINITDARKSIASGSFKGSKISELFKPINAVIAAYFINSQNEEMKEDGKGFEQIMALSNRFRPIESVSDNLVSAAHEVFSESFANSKYFTEKIRKANTEILTAMNPRNILETAGFDEEELRDAEKEQENDLSSLIIDANSAEDFPYENLGVGEISLDPEAVK